MTTSTKPFVQASEQQYKECCLLCHRWSLAYSGGRPTSVFVLMMPPKRMRTSLPKMVGSRIWREMADATSGSRGAGAAALGRNNVFRLSAWTSLKVRRVDRQAGSVDIASTSINEHGPVGLWGHDNKDRGVGHLSTE